MGHGGNLGRYACRPNSSGSGGLLLPPPPPPPGKGFAVEGSVDNSPVQGTLVYGLFAVRHVVSGPRGAFKCPTGLGDCPEVGKKLRGLVRVCRGKDCRQRGIALSPDIYVCDQAPAGSL